MVDHLVVEGGAYITNQGYQFIGRLEVLGTSDSQPDYPQPVDYQIDKTTGSVKFRGNEYNIRKTITLPIVPAVDGTTNVTIPATGLIRNARIYCSSKTGITNFQILGGVAGSLYNHVDDMVAGGWCKSPTAAKLNYSSSNWYSTTGAHVVQVTTDETFVEGTSIVMEIEMLTRSPDPASNEFDDNSSPPVVMSDGAPSFSAAFVGQRCLDVTGGTWLTAVSAGNGASDWS
jgi:hypothetical protein